ILEQTPPIPDSCQWCMFLRNHDELTLEMVTDEERDYMYRAYAEDRLARINLGIRRRLAPLLRNDRRRIELMNALLFSLPGTPVIYYGDEIGMGDNFYLGDRNGVRTPMQWSGDRNAGFSRANPQRLYLPITIDPEYHYEAVNVEAQQNNSSSLLWWMKRLIALRKRFKAFGRGTLDFLRPANSKVLAFVRKYGEERILVVANLSRFVQFAELDLHEYIDVCPEEVFGRTLFPKIGEAPYVLTLGPHGFFWFSLPIPAPVIVETATGEVKETIPALPVLSGNKSLAERFDPIFIDDEIEPLLPEYLTRRQFSRNGSPVVNVAVQHAVRVGPEDIEVWFLLLDAEFREGVPEVLSLVLAFVPEEAIGGLAAPVGEVGFVRASAPAPGVLCDALAVPACCRSVLRGILTGRVRLVPDGELVLSPTGSRLTGPEVDALDALPVWPLRNGPNIYAVAYGEEYILKTFNRVEEGISPSVEIGRFLAAHPGYSAFAPVVGTIEYRRRGAEPATLNVLHRYVPHQGTAWQYAIDELSRYFERVAALSKEAPPRPPEAAPLLGPCPECAGDWNQIAGGFVESTRLLGRRTAEMHTALAAEPHLPAFAPEPFSKLYQRSIYQEMRNIVGKVCRRLNRMKGLVPEFAREPAARLLALEASMVIRFHGVLNPKIGGARLRAHGDYQLGRLLYTGKDFVVADFEGEPTRTLEDRRVKRSPLRDVASMILSFDYAMQATLHGLESRRGRAQGVIRDEDLPTLAPWAEAWYHRTAREFTTAYVEAMGPTRLLPAGDADRLMLLELFILEKALNDAEDELFTHPEKVVVPIRSILRIMASPKPSEPT
ncbi:MAG TPA: alpha-glucosidase C-terminal domain-containing protein, partial [Gemmataceae bacterium]